MKASIAVLAGDGIGTEVTAEAVRALRQVASRFGHRFEFESALLGGAAIDATGLPLPQTRRCSISPVRSSSPSRWHGTGCA